jgi:hypothetical protein
VATTKTIAAPTKAIAGLQNISAVMQSTLRRVVEQKRSLGCGFNGWRAGHYPIMKTDIRNDLVSG